jgi:large subunit ribosomal protein L9
MQVILKKDVKKLGKKNEIVKVSDGYARNYLLPKGLADEATSTKLNEIKVQKKVANKKHQNRLVEARKMAEEMEKKEFQIYVKAGEGGRLFGSVTSKDIAEAVEREGFKIDRRKIILDNNIKTLGDHKIDVKVYEDVIATLKIQVTEL